ncbi:MAG: hypothetical protein JXM73_17305 [Anaerolineae bacterium]|nr:hypothetical protein [Anaerolineae bacterium]
MNRIIGFDRKLQLDWLDYTVGLCQDALSPKVIGERLDARLSSEIGGSEARRKTITVLLRIWANVPAAQQSLRDEGLDMASRIGLEERLWLHWGMSLLAYPFFRDVASVVGQLGSLQGTFSQAQVQRRMIETWGQRTTLERAVRRLLRTFVEWQVLFDAGDRGSYHLVPAHQTDNRALALWLMECALRANEAEQVPLGDMARLPYNFPFELTAFVGELRRSQRFETARQGLDLEMVALAG